MVHPKSYVPSLYYQLRFSVLRVFRSCSKNALNFVVGSLLVMSTASLLLTPESITTKLADVVSSVYPINITPPQSVERIDICFVSSIYGKSNKATDKPGDFRDFSINSATSHRFFLYTNLPSIEAPGWTKIVKDLKYRRLITQSRWGKFMSWKDPEIQGCKTVFYFDGYFAPQNNPSGFLHMSAAIHDSEVGFAQVNHPFDKHRTPLQEFEGILELKKDIPSNVEKSIEWLNAQPDFYNNCTLYANWYFGFDPTNSDFQQATQFFWDHYSQEEDSWRDQPLWCYTLGHFHLRPIPMQPLFHMHLTRMGHKGHRYDKGSDNDADAGKI